MELTLNTPQQHAIADLLWSAESEDAVEAIVATYGHVAAVVRDLMIAAAFDEQVQAPGPEVQELLARFR